MTIDLDLTKTVEISPAIEDKMMASFRVDRDEWNRFGLLAKRERLNATQVLTEYIQKCLDADRTYFGSRMSTDESSTDNKLVSTNNDDVLKLVDERISTAISTLSLQTPDPAISMGNDEILSLIESKISTAISTLSLQTPDPAISMGNDEILDLIESKISTAISTLSLQAPDPAISMGNDEGKGLTMAQMSTKIGKTRQDLESARDKGTLGEFGYRSEKNGRNWVYYPLER